MIYDCFLYNGERELLEISINEFSNVKHDVVHVLIEADHTHTGEAKQLYYPEQRLAWNNLQCMAVIDMPVGSSPREMEEHQRNSIIKALALLDPKDEDIIIIRDIDEIPRAEKVKKFHPSMQFASLRMSKYAYYLNLLEEEDCWDRARIMLWGYLKNKTPEEVRNSGYDYIITHAGWHFSWVIDPVRKLKSFSHTELDTPENIERIDRRENIWNDAMLKMVDIDLSFPRYLYDNQNKFKHLIAHCL